jgi:predicted TPR repeat methyltransferase
MSFDNMLQKALTLHQQGQLDEAEIIYREILETAPKNAMVMHFLAMIAVTKGAYETAISILYKAIEIDKKSAALYFNLAMALQGAGYLGEALENYEKAVKMDKDFAPEGYNNMANIYRIKKEIKKAEKFYRKSIDSAPEKAFFAHNGLGLLQRENGDNEAALESFQTAIDIEPASADAYANMAATLRSMGRIFEALPLYEKALSLDSANPVILTGYGMALELDGKREQAKEQYTKAIHVNPDFADAYAHKGAIETEAGNFKEAEKNLKKATEIDPEHAEAWLNLGVVLYNEKLYLEAMEAYRKAIILNPENPEVCNNLAIAVHAAGDLEEAAGLCFNAIALDKNFKEVHNTLSVILTDMYKVNKDLAVGTAQAWVKHCPDNATAKYVLASFTKDKDTEKASDEYIKQHFDGFANSFDDTLANLDYKAPILIADKLKTTEETTYQRALDMGCGTGLCGKEIKPFVKYLVGVDMSAAMLQKARESGVYDHLEQAEIETFLNEYANKDNTKFDLITAADVLCYFGRLDKIFLKAGNVLKSGGIFIFTLEENTNAENADDYVITETGRFTHRKEYVSEKLQESGFQQIEITSAELRKEQGKAVQGMLITALKN